MEMVLYLYSGRHDAANKIVTITPSVCEVVADFTDENELTVYGEFSPTGAVFELATLYTCNYIKYLYAGVWYYGSVTTSTRTRGKYTYTVTVDALTTAWYQGCMEVRAFIEYSNNTTDYTYRKLDPRIPRAEGAVHYNKNKPASVMSDVEDFDVVMITLNPDQSTTSYAPACFTPGAYRIYVFSKDPTYHISGTENYMRFCRNVYEHAIDTLQSIDAYTQSILQCYVVPSYVFNWSSSIYPARRGAVTLRKIGDELFKSFNYETFSDTSTDKGFSAYNLDALNTTQLASTDVEFDFDITEVGNATAWTSKWEIFIPYIGQVNFVPATMFPMNVNKVGVSVSLNPIGGFYRVLLYYKTEDSDEKKYPTASIFTFDVTEQTQFPAPASSAISVGSIIQTVVGGVSAIGQAAVGMIPDTSAFMSGATDILTQALTVEAGGSAIGKYSGCVSRSLYTPYDDHILPTQQVRLSCDYIPYDDNQDSFALLFSYPHNTTGMISGMPSGYIKTRNAVLDRKALPAEIIDAATAACNAGFWKY